MGAGIGLAGLAWTLFAATPGIVVPPPTGAGEAVRAAPPPSADPTVPASGAPLRLTVLLQFDLTSFSGPGEGSNEGTRPSGIYGNLRRGRFGLEGELASSLRYALSYEFGGAAGEGRTFGKLNAAWLGWRARPWIEARIGIFSAPGGLEGASTDLVFFERAAPAAVRRNITGNSSRPAAGLFANGRRWTASVVANGDSIYANSARGQRTVSARTTIVPVDTDRMLLHLGAVVTAVPQTRIARGENAAAAIRFAERGELRTDETRFVDTGEIPAGNAFATSAEFGVQWRRWLLQAEHVRFVVDRTSAGLPDADFDGFHVQLSGILRGAARRYSRKNASFAAPVHSLPTHIAGLRGGAWEVALRYSSLDLDHRRGREGVAAAPGAVRGGGQEAFSLGLNWYASATIRLQAMMQRVTIDRLSREGSQIGGRINTVSLRAQYAF